MNSKKHKKKILHALKKYPILKSIYKGRLKFIPNEEDKSQIKKYLFDDTDCNLSDIVQHNKDYNAFFYPNKVRKDFVPLTPYSSVTAEDICKIHYLFIDMDFKDACYKTTEDFLTVVNKFNLKPTMIVFSGRGVHVYWRVKDVAVYEFKSLQQRLALFFKTDSKTCDPGRVLRLPYTYNIKDLNDKKLCKILEYNNDLVYRKKDFDALLPKQKKGRPRKAVAIDGVDYTPSELPVSFINIKRVFTRVGELFRSKSGIGWNKRTGLKNTRSDNDYQLAGLLIDYGFSPQTIAAVLLNTRKAKEMRPSIRKKYVEHTLGMALAENKNSDLYNKINSLSDHTTTSSATHIREDEFVMGSQLSTVKVKIPK